MVRRFKVPQFARHSLSANELSGWPDGIAYSPIDTVETKRKTTKLEQCEESTPLSGSKAIPIEALIGLGSESIVL